MNAHDELLICPSCNRDITVHGTHVACSNCNLQFPIVDNIPSMFLENDWEETKRDVSDSVNEFYESAPFPNYEDQESVVDLVNKSESSYYAKFLNDQIPFNTNVLEVGCGTGQLSNYLGLASRNVFGTDMCLNSLKLGEDFRSRHAINNTKFFRMNLFRPIFGPESFHLVICQGVLHHTSDPYMGFQSISKLVKKGGFIIIGLYNTYGRLITDFRRHFFNLFSDKAKFIDPRLRKTDRGSSKRDSWFKDQYKHPHESKHTIGEVLRWFNNNGFEFINAIPKVRPFSPITIDEQLFKPNPRGNVLDHFIVQAKSILDGYREGGLFIMIGRKQ